MITETERNKELLLLLNTLITNQLYDDIVRVGNIIRTDTLAMKKSFQIMTQHSADSRIVQIYTDFGTELKNARDEWDQHINNPQ